MNKDNRYFYPLLSNNKDLENTSSASLHSSPINSSAYIHQQNGELENKYSASSVLFQYPSSAQTSTLINPFLRTLEYIGARSPSTPSAAVVSYRLQKLINAEKKVLRKRHELLKGLSYWIGMLNNQDNKRLLVEFSRIIEMQGRLDEELARKKENINLQLKHVSQRENKAEDLQMKRTKTFRQLREQERKNGENLNTCLSKEALEELNISIEVVEEQLVKSINTSLKGSLVDYVLSMQGVATDTKEGCNEFFKYMNTDTMYNFRKSYLLNDETDQKIELINNARKESEDKQNRPKLKPMGSRKNKAMDYIPQIPATETEEDLKDESFANQNESHANCESCGCLLNGENTIHMIDCPLVARNPFRDGLHEVPNSNHSSNMPGRLLSQRVSSVLKNSVW
ncbi:hypothetical protein CANARDRAFT_27786 [[Candida] arabinofermentans NRRL YB-2248]|uniref:Uncharacterized protein n=1 Tax=[Candida] arabinofermentans NRRL YB-2248 TaxID=983967 RepID=A0A1E4T1Q3_9ASCO|nr:hypothetical protein CANARDRAFT_27786 [[Candida] arabinofermentans NRRL YB-2248]